ncbi:aldo/keto reductase [Methanogenium cariaci]|uniref:aldo/keto reductase n=1 Tax=Methanogenium cariaci TaxID=2197 RepID=UPI0007822AE0|nr:aldo/keto reductase [Methanogenium cariaci]
MDEYLTEQLRRLGTDYLDAYFLHALSKDRWEKLLSLGVIDYLDQAKTEGKIRYTGFSFHDTYDAFHEIIDSYDWDLCQIQYNYLDEEYQAGLKGLKYASSQNVSVIVMEHYGGEDCYPTICRIRQYQF